MFKILFFTVSTEVYLKSTVSTDTDDTTKSEDVDFTEDPSTQSQNETQKNGALELTIGSVATILLIAIAIGFMTKYYYKNKYRSKLDEKSHGDNIEMNVLPPSRCMPIQDITKGKISIPSQEEFDILISFDGGIIQRVTTSQGERYNKNGGFNRVPQNIPFDHNRIILKNPINQCDYINANMISPPSDERTYDELIYTSHQPYKSILWAVGQNPLPKTMDHHFRLIHENRFDTIIGFTDNSSISLFESSNKYRYKDLDLKVLNQTQINHQLLRTDFTLSSDSLVGYEYKHYASYYELGGRQEEEIGSIKHAERLVSSICAIRNNIKGSQASAEVFVHDSRGGVAGGALFVVMYELMEQIDSSITEDKKVKNGAPDIDVFSIVNRLRKDRAKMIEDYETYKLLFHCIAFYGKNRATLKENDLKIDTRDPTENERMDQTTDACQVMYQNDPEIGTTEEQEIEYVMHESDDEDRYSIFDEYTA